jgi:hypothetical protein
MRTLLHEDVRMVMFGDDGESDSIIYSLFSDICSRRLDTSELRKILNFFHVMDNQVDTIFRLQDNIPVHDPVEKIYINLVDDTDSDYYLKFGRRILPTSNSFQAALDLFQDDRLDITHVSALAENLIHEFHYTREEIEKSFDELVRREKLGEPAVRLLLPHLKEHGLLNPEFEPSVKPKPVSETKGSVVISLEGAFDPWIPGRVDYMHDYR